VDNKFSTLLKSRKFWALIIGLIVVVIKTFNPNIPLTADGLMSIVALIATYIFGTGLEDGLTAMAIRNAK
jgi:uncharacterized membrane protein YdjX (TVP38/TMEM64 family)